MESTESPGETFKRQRNRGRSLTGSQAKALAPTGDGNSTHLHQRRDPDFIVMRFSDEENRTEFFLSLGSISTSPSLSLPERPGKLISDRTERGGCPSPPGRSRLGVSAAQSRRDVRAARAAGAGPRVRRRCPRAPRTCASPAQTQGLDAARGWSAGRTQGCAARTRERGRAEGAGPEEASLRRRAQEGRPRRPGPSPEVRGLQARVLAERGGEGSPSPAGTGQSFAERGPEGRVCGSQTAASERRDGVFRPSGRVAREKGRRPRELLGPSVRSLG